jgi:hypothetical protein
MTGRSVQNGAGNSEAGGGMKSRDWQLGIVRQLQSHGWRLV